MRTKLKQATLAFMALILTLLLLHSNFEAFCFIYPGIYTRYAPGYSDQAWGQVSTGMTVQAIQQLLGEPLNIQRKERSEIWSYTLDGKCGWRGRKLADYAWLCRQVQIDEGRVARVESSIRYD